MGLIIPGPVVGVGDQERAHLDSTLHQGQGHRQEGPLRDLSPHGTDTAMGAEAARRDISAGPCCWHLVALQTTGWWALGAQHRALGSRGTAAEHPSSGTFSACLSAWRQIHSFEKDTQLPRLLACGDRGGLPNGHVSLFPPCPWNPGILLWKGEPPSQGHYLGCPPFCCWP